jgi:acetyl esterase/lipase
VAIAELLSSLPPVIRNVEYGSGGGRALLLDIYIPKNPIRLPAPAVVWVHGGGWRNGSKDGGRGQWLADHGFIGVSIDYRLSSEAVFPAAVEDCKCAIRFLRANASEYGIDPERIGAWGSSAGGHLVLMLGMADEKAGLEGSGGWTGVSSRVQAVCSYFGPTDLTAMKEGGDITAPRLFIGGTSEDMPDAYRKASPVTYVSQDDPPLLLVHGTNDRTVPITQSQKIFNLARQTGVDSTFITVQNAGHGFSGTGISPSIPEIEAAVLQFFIGVIG